MTTTKRLGKASLKMLTIALMAMSLAVGASALATKSQPAFAYTPKSAGQPGQMQVLVVQGASNGTGLPELTLPTRYVWRSDAYAGTQVITLTYRLWKYNAASGTWGLFLTRVSSAQVAPNGIGTWIAAWSTPVMFDHFSVNYQVNWTTLDGSLLAWKIIDYNTPTDFQCLTATGCAVYASNDVGAFIYFSPPAPKPVIISQPTQASAQQNAQPSGGSSVTIPGGVDPGYALAFSGSTGRNDASCGGTCRLLTDYDDLLGWSPGSGTDPDFAQAGAELSWLRYAANNPCFGRVLC